MGELKDHTQAKGVRAWSRTGTKPTLIKRRDGPESGTKAHDSKKKSARRSRILGTKAHIVKVLCAQVVDNGTKAHP
jgi:hypothetical protein